MKPLERIFFQACVMNCWCMKGVMMRDTEMSVRDVVNFFHSLGFPIKQLMYYLKKWNDYRIYDYGISKDLGWFYIDNFKGEYKVMYEQIQNTKRVTDNNVSGKEEGAE